MTLIDSRVGIKAVYDAVSAETGVRIDSDLVVSRLGPPVEDEMANWFPSSEVPAMADLYRHHYATYAISATPGLLGAPEAMASVAALGGRVVVITGKTERFARQHLEHLVMRVDDVIGGAWMEGKVLALSRTRAHVYVGDHVEDVRAARAAGVVSVSVPSGPCTAGLLRSAGADVVLDSLAGFPGWLNEWATAEGLA
jgi:phosphoglycolate phosphatase